MAHHLDGLERIKHIRNLLLPSESWNRELWGWERSQDALPILPRRPIPGQRNSYRGMWQVLEGPGRNPWGSWGKGICLPDKSDQLDHLCYTPTRPRRSSVISISLWGHTEFLILSWASLGPRSPAGPDSRHPSSIIPTLLPPQAETIWRTLSVLLTLPATLPTLEANVGSPWLP